MKLLSRKNDLYCIMAKTDTLFFLLLFWAEGLCWKICKNWCLTWLLIDLAPHNSAKLCKDTHFIFWELEWCQVWLLSHFTSQLVQQRMHIFLSGMWLTHVMHKDAIKACLVGIQRDRQTPRGKRSHMGEKLGSAFEAWVNEALLLIWGVEEGIGKRMPVMQTDIPEDGSFYSKDKCHVTLTASRSNNSCRLWGAEVKWIVQQQWFEWIVSCSFKQH